jgi:hypothetical protein
MGAVKVCERCGHPLPEMEVLLDLTKMQQRMFTVVQRAGRAGVTADVIMDRLYDGRGPDSTNILTVMKHAMQPKLQKHKMKLTVRTGPGALWRLDAIV